MTCTPSSSTRAFSHFHVVFSKCLTHSDQPAQPDEMNSVIVIPIGQMGKLRHGPITVQPGSGHAQI